MMISRFTGCRPSSFQFKALFFLLLIFVGLMTPLQAGEEQRWEEAIDHVAQAVLAIRVDAPRSFDTSINNSVEATGFVIDAEQGIVLTNRHVVQPGPIVAKGIFLNREEIKLIPIYRDPIHDFGFFKYDPKALTYNNPEALKLLPEAVQRGREIKVVGNDGGEQLSILSGTIARLDRQAPAYGPGGFNDFNTFYIQAASSTSGGSSGAPVIDIEGNVIALNAGGNMRNAASFYLPLDRVVHAFELLRKGEKIIRGTLQTTFQYQPYDELRRLGLSDKSEQQVRAQDPDAIGLLTVAFYVPQGPAEGLLEAGDILLKINGEWIRHFVSLEAMLDRHVGEGIAVTIERAGEQLELTLKVQNLDEITPARYIDVGGAILHDLSYQQARSFHIPVSGLYVAYGGYAFGNESIGRGSVITSIAGEPVKAIDDAAAILKTLSDGERFSVRFFLLINPRQQMQRIVTMDRRWFTAATCHRDDKTGVWPCEEWPAQTAVARQQPGTTRFITSTIPALQRMAQSLVQVNFDMPYVVEGISDTHYTGAGLVVDAGRGWVLVDRDTVPTTMGDVAIIFAGSLEVPGKVEYIHPLHNIAMVSYDPALIGDTPVRNATFSDKGLSPGDDVWLIGTKMNHKLIAHKTTVAETDMLSLPLPSVPRYRATNVEVISLTSQANTVGGVLTDHEGAVQALWSSFGYQRNNKFSSMVIGVPAELVQELLKRQQQATSAAITRTISSELNFMPLNEARKRGLNTEWALKMEAHDPEQRHVLHVERVVAGTPAASLLEEGDLLLAIDGRVVTTFLEVERAAQQAELKVTVLRRGEIAEVDLPTEALDGIGLSRIVSWAGAIFHRQQREIAAQRGRNDDGLYISWTWKGSPAAHYGVYPSSILTELEGVTIRDLDGFVARLKEIAGRESVRVKLLHLNGKETMLTLKLDNHYWPAFELQYSDEHGWQRSPIGPQ